MRAGRVRNVSLRGSFPKAKFSRAVQETLRVSRGQGIRMQPSMFNLRVPVTEGNEVFLMNTLSDAQLLVSADVAELLDRVRVGDQTFNPEEYEARAALTENGFIVNSREDEQMAIGEF